MIENPHENQPYLIFTLTEKSYAISFNYLKEIIALPPVVSVPGRKSYMRGIFQLRGEILPLIDFEDIARIFQNINDESSDNLTQDFKFALIIEIDNFRFALAVSSLKTMLTYDQNISPSPDVNTIESSNNLFSGILEKSPHCISIIDCSILCQMLLS